MTNVTSPDEIARLAAVRRYDILDTPPDGAFDRITALAARVTGVPISTITIVDEDRIWFKSALGLDGVEQIDREPGLCASAVLGDGPYLVEDAATDPRSLNNPLVRGELGLRFYVGVPLRTSDGHNLGTLNIIDQVPRAISEEQLATLEDLAAIVMDELELRLAARRTVELESLRAAAELRDTIVAGISHEMRTPLAVLQGIANLPLGELEPGHAQEVQTVFHRQVGHLDRLVEQFLDHARLEHGQQPTIRPEPTDVRAIAEQAAELHRDRATVTCDLPAELPLAEADPARTLQIVVELISNAIRFSDDHPTVAVRVSAPDDRWIRLTVTDHGIGIPEATLPHLFEKYVRSSSSTGSGLGLHVARALADVQGGAIEVESTPGVGSSFTLVLPQVGTGGGPSA